MACNQLVLCFGVLFLAAPSTVVGENSMFLLPTDTTRGLTLNIPHRSILVIADDRYISLQDSDGKTYVIDTQSTVDEDTLKEQTVGEHNVTLHLYTQKNPTTPQNVSLSSTCPNFDPSNPTRVLIHGWISSAKNMEPLKKAYMETGNEYNVILVDWRGLAQKEYPTAKYCSQLVGEYLATVIKHLQNNNGLCLDAVSIIGHSLGAHSASVCGNRLKGKIGRIVGLDAAAPLFATTPLENRLDTSDAKFVQCIHTNGGAAGWLGPLGHVDFFPNGGSNQPGCPVLSGCNHCRSLEFFEASINKSNNFLAASCGSYSAYKAGTCATARRDVMGEWTDTSTRGSYYLDTHSDRPYAMG